MFLSILHPRSNNTAKVLTRKGSPLDGDANERTKLPTKFFSDKPKSVHTCAHLDTVKKSNAPAFQSIAGLCSKGAKTPDKPVDWKPSPSQPVKVGATPTQQPTISEQSLNIQSTLTGIMSAITALQTSVNALNQRLDATCNTLEQSKATASKVSATVSKFETKPLTPEQIEHAKIRKQMADQYEANERKLIGAFRAGSAIEARRGVGFR